MSAGMTTVLFIADQFDDASRGAGVSHPGGAELTDRAAIAACPWPVTEVTFGELTLGQLDAHDIHVLGNSSSASREQLAAIAERGRHVLFEHDVRICVWRGNFPVAAEPVHRFKQRCSCPHPFQQRLFRDALGTIFLTHRQRAVFRRNPFWYSPHEAILGCSLFDDDFFERADSRQADAEREGWWVTGSPSVIKGAKEANAYCETQGITPNVFDDMQPQEVLDALETAHRFVYLPIGLEPAGRMPVEARFLGAEVVVNHHVGVTGESWWRLPNDQALEFLRDAPARFWRIVEGFRHRTEVVDGQPLERF
jgi:hypothetical protein